MLAREAEQDTLPRGLETGDGNVGQQRAAEVTDEKPKSERRQDEIKLDQSKPDYKKPEAKDADGKKREKAKSTLTAKWPFVLAGLILAMFVGVVLWIIFRPHPNVWTDDAYVMVHYATIAPRVSGQVSSVAVDDNQAVTAGQVLVTLDPRDYETAVATATAALARDEAQVADVSANLARQPAIISEQEANVASARARLAFTEPDARRYKFLAATDAGTLQQSQRADSALQESQAQLDNALASLDAARRQLDVIKAQQQAAAAVVEVDKAQLVQTRLNLSYTRIMAPVAGLVSERSVQVGNIVSPGAALMTVVPLDSVYVIANYREVDLLHVRGGQHATIHVDAYNIDLQGMVETVPPASGASFAPIQPNNATGNFTKIVQRLPIKINLDPNPLAKLLRVGFSVETTIHTGLEDVVDEQRQSSSRVTTQ